MTDSVTPPAAKPARSLFSQANITTGLAVAAVVLAAAPYVVPQIQTWQVRSGLMHKPAVLEDAFEALQTQKAEKAALTSAEAIKAHRDSIFNDKTDPVIGKGPIKVVEFLDYNCAYCRAATPAMKDFLAANPDVQLVVKEYPVVHPPASRTLAAYGYAAFTGGNYAPVHYALLTQQVQTEADMDAILTKAGIDPKAAKAAALSKAVGDQIDRTINLGGDLGINGTPTFIVDDKMVNGADLASLQAAVAAQRKKAG